MLALRFTYLLALVTWLGGLVALGGVPGQFHVVAAVCGGLMLVTLVAMALLGPRPRPFGARFVLIGLMLAATSMTGIPVALHRLSTALLSATAIGGVCLLYWETREHHY